jgi:hypothetical protein
MVNIVFNEILKHFENRAFLGRRRRHNGFDIIVVKTFSEITIINVHSIIYRNLYLISIIYPVISISLL